MNKSIVIAIVLTLIGAVILVAALTVYFVLYWHHPGDHSFTIPSGHTTGQSTSWTKEFTIGTANYTTSLPTPSPDWLTIGQLLRKQINQSVDPCQNFYDFACGGWIKRNPLTSKSTTNYNIDTAQERIYGETAKILADAANQPNVAYFAKKLILVNQKCLNRVKDVNSKNADILDLFTRLGGWPMISPTSVGSSRLKWDDIGHILGSIQAQFLKNIPLIGLSVLPDLVDPDKFVIYINPGELILQNSSWYNRGNFPTKYDNYLRLFVAMGTLLGKDAGINVDDPGFQQNLVDSVEEMFLLERDLANILQPATTKGGSNTVNYTAEYHQLTLDTIETNYKVSQYWDWGRYLQTAMPGSVQWYVKSPYSKYVVYHEPYFQGLAKVLNDYEQETIVNYFFCKLVWKLLEIDLIQLDQQTTNFNAQPKKLLFFTEKLRKVLPLTAITDPTLIANDCAKLTINYLPNAVANLFLTRHPISNDQISMVRSVFASLQASAASEISDLNWLQPVSKTALISKMQSMTINVAYPPIATNQSALSIVLGSLNVTNQQTWFNIYCNINAFSVSNTFGNLNNSAERTRFAVPALSVLPEYELTQNVVTFPMGLMGSHFLSVSTPNAVKYGVIGNLVGAAMGEALTTQGLMFDGHGELDNNWIDPISRKKLGTLMLCYGQMKICLGDNSAKLSSGDDLVCSDCAGLANWMTTTSSALKWSNLSRRKAGREPRIPDFNDYSMEQVFYISTATFTCGSENENTKIANFKNGIFSDRQKFNEMIKNDANFGKIFNCNPNAPMNPQQKCYVWT